MSLSKTNFAPLGKFTYIIQRHIQRRKKDCFAKYKNKQLDKKVLLDRPVTFRISQTQKNITSDEG